MNANKYSEIAGNSWFDAGSESFFRAVDSKHPLNFSLSPLFALIRGLSRRRPGEGGSIRG
jgi:hypothetical protein